MLEIFFQRKSESFLAQLQAELIVYPMKSYLCVLTRAAEMIDAARRDLKSCLAIQTFPLPDVPAGYLADISPSQFASLAARRHSSRAACFVSLVTSYN